MPADEQTFIVIKPDGIQRALVGKIIKRFEERGYKLIGMKLIRASNEQLEVCFLNAFKFLFALYFNNFFQKHYEKLKDKPFFGSLMRYMGSGPICAMIWEGKPTFSILYANWK